MSKSDIRETYEDRPSCIRYLYESGARQQLADFFLGLAGHWEEDDEPLTKKDIIDATGLQRHSVIDHMDALIEMGVVNKIEGSRWDRYEPALESDPYNALIEVNNIMSLYYDEHHK